MAPGLLTPAALNPGVLLPDAVPGVVVAGCGLGSTPSCWLAEGAQSVFKGFVGMLGDGVLALVRFLASFWLTLPSPQVATGSGDSWSQVTVLADMQGYLSVFTGVIAVVSLAVTLARIAWAGNLQEGRGLLRQVAAMSCATLASAAMVQVLMVAGDKFSPWILDQAGSGGSSAGLQTLLTAGLANGQPDDALGMWMMLFILELVGSLVQCVFMIIRGPAIFVLLVFLPPTAAGAATEEGWHRFKRLVMLLVAFALYKPVAATIYAVGIRLMSPGGAGSDSSDGSVGSALYGLTVLLLAAVALPAFIKFVAPIAAMGSSSVFSGGAAIGAVAGGAAILATGGSGAAAAGAGKAATGGGANTAGTAATTSANSAGPAGGASNPGSSGSSGGSGGSSGSSGASGSSGPGAGPGGGGAETSPAGGATTTPESGSSSPDSASSGSDSQGTGSSGSAGSKGGSASGGSGSAGSGSGGSGSAGSGSAGSGSAGSSGGSSGRKAGLLRGVAAAGSKAGGGVQAAAEEISAPDGAAGAAGGAGGSGGS